MQRSFLHDLLSWNRPGFHPDERSIDVLLDRWPSIAPGGQVDVHSRPRTQQAG